MDELERVRLEVDLARRGRAVDELRSRITAEEATQHQAQRGIDARIGALRRDVERLTIEVGRLETRLERLAFSRRPLSDRELDDEAQFERAEEAAFWASWREQREERRNGHRPQAGVLNHRPRGDEDAALKQVYRELARLIHPDLAHNPADRARREAIMRLANAAHEARDAEQLRRLLHIWTQPDAGANVRDISALRARLADRDIELGQLRRQLRALKDSAIARLTRRPKHELERHLRREEERLRREVATLRLRRRRLLSSLDDRRRELADVSD